MSTWIFQGNPNRFDIDGYLSTPPERIMWLVSRYHHELMIGDQVFLWRAAGDGTHGPSGIIAECAIDSPVTKIAEDSYGAPFWREPRHALPSPRVWLRVEKVAKGSDILKRDDIARHEQLRKIGPLGFSSQTTYRVSDAESKELNALWRACAP